MPDFSDRYSPYWSRVFTGLLGLSGELLDDRWHDCPCCRTPGSFKATPGSAVLHMVCNACGGPDQTGGIITPRDLVGRILRVDRDAANVRIDRFLGIEPERAAHRLSRPRISAIDAASGRWPELLGALAGISPEQLTDKHQPCPACGARIATAGTRTTATAAGTATSAVARTTPAVAGLAWTCSPG